MIPLSVSPQISLLNVNRDISQISRLQDQAEMKKQVVASEFESVFINQLMKEFDASVDWQENPVFGGKAEKMYRGMLNQELSRSMAAAGGIGLAEMLIPHMV